MIFKILNATLWVLCQVHKSTVKLPQHKTSILTITWYMAKKMFEKGKWISRNTNPSQNGIPLDFVHLDIMGNKYDISRR